ncbi:MAG: flagellar basal body-associated FliL family protein [Roseivivax sp.]|nr:flagellar basal body-associated FliL family protein [Roseivivax sp.]
MLRILLPVILALVGIGAGVGAGIFLSGGAEEHTEVAADCPAPTVIEVPEGEAPEVRVDAAELVDREFVKLNNQFVVPVVTETRVAALVVLSITIETQIGKSEVIYAREPKLRDLFLQTLFDQASLGRFSGEFANAANLRPLRDELTVIARRVLGPEVSDVLITDISRQDA